MVSEWVRSFQDLLHQRFSMHHSVLSQVAKENNTRKWVVGKLGGMESRPAQNSRWNDSNQKGNCLSELSRELLSITDFYSSSPQMKEMDTNPYRALVDWRKISIAVGVENKLVRPRAGERHSPCRNRGHISVPATGLSCWFFPSAFCSVLFFSVSQRLRTDGNH